MIRAHVGETVEADLRAFLIDEPPRRLFVAGSFNEFRTECTASEYVGWLTNVLQQTKPGVTKLLKWANAQVLTEAKCESTFSLIKNDIWPSRTNTNIETMFAELTITSQLHGPTRRAATQSEEKRGFPQLIRQRTVHSILYRHFDAATDALNDIVNDNCVGCGANARRALPDSEWTSERGDQRDPSKWPEQDKKSVQCTGCGGRVHVGCYKLLFGVSVPQGGLNNSNCFACDALLQRDMNTAVRL